MTTSRVTLRYRASEPQAEFVNATAQFPAFVGGFGSGKTEAGIKRALRLKFANPAQDVAYYLPTYDLVRMIGYQRFSEILVGAGVRFNLNKSEHVLTIKDKGRIIFRTMDNPERIVGYEVADSILDEFDTLKREDAEYVWRQVIARNRQKKSDGAANTVGVVTTPEGFRFVYERWEEKPVAGYQLVRASTYSNERNLPAGYINNLRASYAPQLIEAFIEGRFVNLTSGAVYPDFNRAENGCGDEMVDGEELHIGVDFNVYNCTGVVGVIREGFPRIVGELTKVRDTPALIDTIKQTYPGHRINVYPDASGQSNKTVNASESDVRLLRMAGFNVIVPPRNPLVKERVMSVNGLLLNGEGRRALRINAAKAPTLVKCLEQQVYDENGQPDKSSDIDHAPDALGYFIYARWPIIKPGAPRTVHTNHMGR